MRFVQVYPSTQREEKDMRTVTTSHDGLVWHSKSRYQWKKGKRVPLGENETPSGTWTEMRMTLFPSPMLVPHTWKRYGLTIDDGYRVFDKIDVAYLWQLVFMFLPEYEDCEVVTTAIRSTFQSMFQFLFISRRVLVSHFVDAHKKDFLLTGDAKPVLCLERNDHKPCLPNVVIPDWQEWVGRIPAKPPSYLQVTHYEKARTGNGVLMVPVAMDPHGRIQAQRIILKTVYDSIPVLPPLCAATAPCVVKLQSDPDQEYVLVHECCWWISELSARVVPSKKRKRAHDDSAPQAKKKSA